MDFNHPNEQKPLAEINMIPLIDVMLVLLVLFIITAPLLIPHAIKIEVPEVTSQANLSKADVIVLAIDERGLLYWNDEAIDVKELDKRLHIATQKKLPAELHLRADKQTQYQKLAEIMAIIQNAGITRLGFIMEPN